MIDKRSGKAAYAVMNFGGFLGIGEDSYPLPWSVLTYNTRPRRLRGQRHRRAAQGRAEVPPRRQVVGEEPTPTATARSTATGALRPTGCRAHRNRGASPEAEPSPVRLPSPWMGGGSRYSSARMTKNTATIATATKNRTKPISPRSPYQETALMTAMISMPLARMKALKRPALAGPQRPAGDDQEEPGQELDGDVQLGLQQRIVQFGNAAAGDPVEPDQDDRDADDDAEYRRLFGVAVDRNGGIPQPSSILRSWRNRRRRASPRGSG